MKLAMVVQPMTDETLKVPAQLGVDALVYYDMHGIPMQLSVLQDLKRRANAADLELAVFESGPRMDRIVMGKAGAAEQIEQYKRGLELLGRIGAKVVCYNFMPQVSADAMVVRTAHDLITRGGAITSGFALDQVHDALVPHTESPIPREQMWDNLERFLRAVIPAAEDAGIRLAMHPDDPPLSPICGLHRIMDSVASFERLLALSSSPANSVTLCQGCFSELGADIPGLVRSFRDRIAFVHFRDVLGELHDFIEVFPDAGKTDMLQVFRALSEIGYDGYMRADHAPRLATDHCAADLGYSLQGHIYTVGYMKGLMEATFGKRRIDG